jgi:hypothetical protein
MSKRLLIIIGALAVLACVVCVGFVVVLGGGVYLLTKPVADAGDGFMNALKDGDYVGAHAMMTDALKDDVGGVEDLQVMFVKLGAAPESWSYSNRSIDNNTGTLSGTVTLANAKKMDLELSLIKEGDTWKIKAFNFQEQ